MPAFKYTPTSINARTIVGGSILAAYFVRENGPLSTRPYAAVTATRIGKADQAVRSQPKPAVWRLRTVLSAINQSDLAALHTMFNEAEGAVYLRITDGDSVVWRTTVVVQAIEPVIGILAYDVVLYVPDPTWEADVLITDSELNKTTSPITMGTAVPGNKTPGGDRECPAAFTLTADAAKGIASILDDTVYSLRGLLINRSPKPLTNWPVWLFDQSGVAARLATGSSAAGATVLQTTGLTSITVDIVQPTTVITLASVAGWPAVGMGFLTDSRGPGFHDQFYYTSIVGLELRGVVWLRAASAGSDPGFSSYTAGGIAHTQVQETAIQPSGIQSSGDDVRVELDGSPNVKRTLAAWNTGSSDVVIHVTLPERIKLTLAAAMTATVPAVGGVLEFAEGVSQLPPAGFLAVENEVLHYSAKSGRGVVLDGSRGQWATTAAIHAVTAPVYANPHHYVVSAGWARAPVGNVHSLADRAACQIAGTLPSSNQVLKYANVQLGSGDPSSVYFDGNRPGRAASWAPGFDTDGNTVAPLMSIDPANGIAGGEILRFKDDVPGDGSPPYNYAELTVPTGIDAGNTSAIINDWAPSPEILNLELSVRDVNGQRKLIDQLQQAAAAGNRTLPAALSQIAYGLKLKGRYNIITGWHGLDSLVKETITNASTPIPVNGIVAVKFTLSDARVPTGILARLAKTTAGTQNVAMELFTDDTTIFPSEPGVGYVGATVVLISGTAPTFYRFPLGQYALTKGATYWAVFYQVTTFTSVNFYGSWFPATFTDRTAEAVYTGGVWQGKKFDEQLWFYLTCGYDNQQRALLEANQPVQIPAASGVMTRTAVTAAFDGTEIVIEPSQSVYVHRKSAFVQGTDAGSMHHLNGVIANTTTGDSMSLDRWVMRGDPAFVFVIDSGAGTVLYTEQGVVYPSEMSITPSDRSRLIMLKPAVANALTYTDPSLLAPGQLDFVTTYRAQRV